MKKMHEKIVVEGFDGAVWEVPVEIVARHRADAYKDEFGGDVQRSLDEDTRPAFTQNPLNITDWACNNMDPKDFGDSPVMVKKPRSLTFADVWGEAQEMYTK